jgi:hypothetical protein
VRGGAWRRGRTTARRLIASIAVVGSFTPGDRARGVISTSWRRPNATSCCIVRSRPTQERVVHELLELLRLVAGQRSVIRARPNLRNDRTWHQMLTDVLPEAHGDIVVRCLLGGPIQAAGLQAPSCRAHSGTVLGGGSDKARVIVIWLSSPIVDRRGR